MCWLDLCLRADWVYFHIGFQPWDVTDAWEHRRPLQLLKTTIPEYVEWWIIFLHPVIICNADYGCFLCVVNTNTLKLICLELIRLTVSANESHAQRCDILECALNILLLVSTLMDYIARLRTYISKVWHKTSWWTMLVTVIMNWEKLAKVNEIPNQTSGQNLTSKSALKLSSAVFLTIIYFKMQQIWQKKTKQQHNQQSQMVIKY